MAECSFNSWFFAKNVWDSIMLIRNLFVSDFQIVISDNFLWNIKHWQLGGRLMPKFVYKTDLT